MKDNGKIGLGLGFSVNPIPVIAKTSWKKFLHKFFSSALKQFVIFYGLVISSACVFLKSGFVGFCFVQKWNSSF